VTFTPVMNGRPALLRKDGHVPSYRVRPGRDLVMSVAVTVPKHLRLTALWLGISTGTWGNGPGGRPTGMRPILVHSGRPLSTGVHTFGLRWRIPKHRSGSVYLTMAWTSRQPSASVSGPVARLVLS
jgi:hypothetical protein